MTTENDVVLRTLYSRGDTLQCVVRLLRVAIQGQLLWNGHAYLSRLFATDAELQAWAQEERAEHEAQGWVAVDSSGSPDFSH